MLGRILLSVVLSAGVLSLAAGVFWALYVTKAPAPEVEPIVRPLVVQTVAATPRELRKTLVGFGNAEAELSARISAEVSGEIVELSRALRPGAPIRAGEVVLRIDPRDYDAAVERAESNLASAEAELSNLLIEEENLREQVRIARVELDVAEREQARLQGLFESGLAGRREFDLSAVDSEAKRRNLQERTKQLDFIPNTRKQREATVRLRKADLSVARINRQRCDVSSPFDGRVSGLHVEIGERTSIGTRLFTVLDPNLIEVPLELPLGNYPELRVGATAELRSESTPDVLWKGEVVRIAPAGSVSMRTFEAYVLVDNREQQVPLVPGMFVRAEVAGPVFTDVIALPRDAVTSRGVFVYRDGMAHTVEVTETETIGNQKIVRGLTPGAQVIVTNLAALSQGRVVQLPDSESGPAPGSVPGVEEVPREPSLDAPVARPLDAPDDGGADAAAELTGSASGRLGVQSIGASSDATRTP